MATQGDDDEVARIINEVERTFGQAAPSSSPNPDRKRRAEMPKRRLAAMLGGLLAVATATGLGLAGWHGSDRASPSHHPVVDRRQLPPAPPRMPGPGVTPSGQVEHAPLATAETPHPAAVHRAVRPRHLVRTRTRAESRRAALARPATRRVQPTLHAAIRDGAVADRLSGEALQRALREDSIRTRQLNEAELRKTAAVPSSARGRRPDR